MKKIILRKWYLWRFLNEIPLTYRDTIPKTNHEDEPARIK